MSILNSVYFIHSVKKLTFNGFIDTVEERGQDNDGGVNAYIL